MSYFATFRTHKVRYYGTRDVNYLDYFESTPLSNRISSTYIANFLRLKCFNVIFWIRTSFAYMNIHVFFNHTVHRKYETNLQFIWFSTHDRKSFPTVCSVIEKFNEKPYCWVNNLYICLCMDFATESMQ